MICVRGSEWMIATENWGCAFQCWNFGWMSIYVGIVIVIDSHAYVHEILMQHTKGTISFTHVHFTNCNSIMKIVIYKVRVETTRMYAYIQCVLICTHILSTCTSIRTHTHTHHRGNVRDKQRKGQREKM